MNADRRDTAKACIALMQECSFIGEISDSSHVALVEIVKHLEQSEFWQLKNQERHEGKNEPTDKQIAICRVALPALQTASAALKDDDFDTVVQQLTLAITTDGTMPRKKRRTA